MPITYEPIATTTLGSATASVTFSSISGNYTDLVLVFSGTVSAGAGGRIQFNGDTTSNYSNTILSGNGTSATSSRESSITSGRFTYEGSIGNTDATRNVSIIQIMNYTNATTFKTWLSRANRPSAGLDAIVGLWRKSPETITSITLSVISDTFATGSTFTLYGIKAA
jgi:hypothetical protein